MEDTGVLRNIIQWLFPGGRVTLKAILFWLLLVVLFTAYGFIDSKNQLRGGSFSIPSAAEGAILLGGLGVGIASCVTFGLLIVAGLQAERWRKFAAILHLLTSSFVSAISTPVVIVLARPFCPQSWNILRGERVMGIVIVSGWMGMVAIAVFALLTITVLFTHEQQNGVHNDSRNVEGE